MNDHKSSNNRKRVASICSASNYYIISECNDELAEGQLCCDGYLSIGTLDFNFETSSYYETNWPSQFFAEIVDVRDRGSTCCFKLSSADESKSVDIKPETLELFEFEEEKPVKIVIRVFCE